jgi:hypothetical protein
VLGDVQRAAYRGQPLSDCPAGALTAEHVSKLRTNQITSRLSRMIAPVFRRRGLRRPLLHNYRSMSTTLGKSKSTTAPDSS